MRSIGCDKREESMPSNRHVSIIVAAGMAFAPLLGSTAALAQSKETITFAGATFAEAGRGEKLKGRVEKVNKSPNQNPGQALAVPLSNLAHNGLTQICGSGASGP